MPRKKYTQLQSVKGMHDILPGEQVYWDFLFKKARSLLEDYRYRKISLPVLEQTEVFTRTVGEGTDIVEKEMYNLKTKGGDELSLRPEFTASIARAFIENGMSSWPQPVKLYTYGPLFRHDQPQAWRWRQFHHLDAEVIGDETSAADAELIFVLYRLFEQWGFKDLIVRINSIGDNNCRPAYIKALKDYYRPRLKKVCSACQSKYKKNVLRILDCEEEQCREIREEAPQILDFLDDECKTHFTSVLEFLDETNVPYILTPHLVRGLGYYTRTVFEIWFEESEQVPVALAGGGRYDKLIELLGGHKTPAAGWAIGLERVIRAIKEFDIKISVPQTAPKVFLAQLGDLGKKRSLVLFEELRKSNVSVYASFGRDSIKSQLRIANRVGVRFTLILGQKEALDGNVILRDMESSSQETIKFDEAVAEVKKRLKGK